MASAEPHVDQALRLWPTERQDSELIRLLSDATRIKAFAGRNDESSQLAERNLALAEQLGDAGLVAQALSGLSQPHSRRRNELALTLERAIELSLQGGNWRTLTLLYTQCGAIKFLTGDVSGSVADRARALDAADRSGQTERMIFAQQALGGALHWTGAWQDARDAMRTCLVLDPLLEHPYTVEASALLAWMDGQPEEAARYFDQFVVNSRERHDSQGAIIGLAQLVRLKLQLNRPTEAESPAREVLDLLRGWGGFIGFAAGPVAEVLIRLGSSDAESVLSELEQLVDESGDELARPQLLRSRALLCARQHRLNDALEALLASAALARSMNAVIELAQSLLLLAALALQKGDKVAAAQADSERLAIVDRIGPEARVMPWAGGLKHGTRPKVAGQGPLSPRESEVARLIAGGLSNRQIAESLVISERTVENHVSSILSRLGVDTRVQVAAWAVQRGLAAPAP
jgi:DNA-binding NarL/FixJ family response regulator